VSVRALDKTYIVDTALELLRERGVEAFSMRHLTTRLGVAVGATYRHVPNKGDILSACVQRIYEKVERPREPGEDPVVWVRDLLVRLVEVMGDFPGLAGWAAQNGRREASRLHPPVTEALLQSGLSSDQARRTMDVLFFFVTGALTVDYRRVMAAAGVEDYAENLRGDIEHILGLGQAAAAT
jgi:AcrR family transcriptional regulator